MLRYMMKTLWSEILSLVILNILPNFTGLGAILCHAHVKSHFKAPTHQTDLKEQAATKISVHNSWAPTGS